MQKPPSDAMEVGRKIKQKLDKLLEAKCVLAGECEAPGGSRWVRGVPSLLQAFLAGAPPASHREDWGKPGKNSRPGLAV